MEHNNKYLLQGSLRSGSHYKRHSEGLGYVLRTAELGCDLLVLGAKPHLLTQRVHIHYDPKP